MKRAFWDASDQDDCRLAACTSLDTVPAEVLACIVERGQLANWFQTLSCVSRKMRALCRRAERGSDVWGRLSRSMFPRVQRLGPDAARIGGGGSGASSHAAWRLQFYTLVRWMRALEARAPPPAAAAAPGGWRHFSPGGLPPMTAVMPPLGFELTVAWATNVIVQSRPPPSEPLACGEIASVCQTRCGLETAKLGGNRAVGDAADVVHDVWRVSPAALDQSTADVICRRRLEQGNPNWHTPGTHTYVIYV
jgi:hypothetical protein